MGIKDLFRRRKDREKPAAKTCPGISLESQLDALARLGIAARGGSEALPWLLDEWGREVLEASPWLMTLEALGGERWRGDEWEPLSDDIYSIDQECVEEDSAYAAVFHRLAALSKGGFAIENVRSSADPEARRASVAFTLDGEAHEWALEYDEARFDSGAIARINALLQKKGLGKAYYTLEIDQNLVVVFATQRAVAALNRLLPMEFKLPPEGEGEETPRGE